MYDVVILGSGPAGTAAALSLAGKRRVLVTDVGHAPDATSRLEGNFYQLRKRNPWLFRELIGEQFESLHNIDHDYLMPKLKAPLQRYITRVVPEDGVVIGDGFSAVRSYAQGGMANAWGAQLYRYRAEDMTDYPISPQDLEPYYRCLIDRIGISGCDDDLSQFYGQADGLMPPIHLANISKSLLRKYENKKAYLNSHGVYLGRPRLGVLSRPLAGRKRCEYENLEFFKPRIESVYTPAYTLNELVARGDISYEPGNLAIGYEEDGDGVSIQVRCLRTNEMHTIRCKRLIVALGTIGTAKLVLATRKDTTTKLPFVDNQLSYIPFVDFRHLGKKTEQDSFYTQLNMFYTRDDASQSVMGSFYALTGIFNSEVLFDIPLSIASSIVTAKHILPAMMVLHLWYPGAPNKGNYIQLTKHHDVKITVSDTLDGVAEKRLISTLRCLGLWSSFRFARFPEMGNSFHYAGALPMRNQPDGPYETDRYGRLSGSTKVFIVDGAALPSISAKNLSLTIMANAMRIAEHVYGTLGTE